MWTRRGARTTLPGSCSPRCTGLPSQRHERSFLHAAALPPARPGSTCVYPRQWCFAILWAWLGYLEHHRRHSDSGPLPDLTAMPLRWRAPSFCRAPIGRIRAKTNAPDDVLRGLLEKHGRFEPVFARNIEHRKIRSPASPDSRASATHSRAAHRIGPSAAERACLRPALHLGSTLLQADGRGKGMLDAQRYARSRPYPYATPGVATGDALTKRRLNGEYTK
jgi:hypothetical protein